MSAITEAGSKSMGDIGVRVALSYCRNSSSNAGDATFECVGDAGETDFSPDRLIYNFDP
jgi:hypothetical protein